MLRFIQLLFVYFSCILLLHQPNVSAVGCLNKTDCVFVGYDLTCNITNTTTFADFSMRMTECLDQTKTENLTISKVVPGIAYFDLNLIIPINVTTIYFENNSPYGSLVLKASSINNVTSQIIFRQGSFFLNQTDNFFEYFPQVTTIQTSNSYLQFGSRPSFINLKSLTRLEVNIFDPSETYSVFNASIVDGLENLEILKWSGNLKGIEANSLNGLARLTHLDLTGNSLTILPSKLFKQSSLKTLILDRNQFNNFTKDVFEDLDQLEFISINNNPNFLVNSLMNIDSLQRISLQSNSYVTISPMPFQQLSKLTRIDLDGNPFHCDCELRWASIVRSYGIEIIGGNCFTPLNVYQTEISGTLPYTNCDHTEKYLCFDKNIQGCPDEYVCHNTGNIGSGHLCGCPDGFTLDNDGFCIDKDECSADLCQDVCNNTLGSYNCGCKPGFRLKSDGISCEDINECVANNGGCTAGCLNLKGSYMCSGNIDCNDENLPFIVWGSVASVFSILFFIFFLLTVIIVVIYSRYRPNKFEKLERPQQSPSSLTASYTKMESARIDPVSTPTRPVIASSKPIIPPNKPTMVRSRQESKEFRRELPSLPPTDDQLTYEAFDVEH